MIESVVILLHVMVCSAQPCLGPVVDSFYQTGPQCAAAMNKKVEATHDLHMCVVGRQWKPSIDGIIIHKPFGKDKP